jgi:hypothetical protein
MKLQEELITQKEINNQEMKQKKILYEWVPLIQAQVRQQMQLEL